VLSFGCFAARIVLLSGAMVDYCSSTVSNLTSNRSISIRNASARGGSKYVSFVCEHGHISLCSDSDSYLDQCKKMIRRAACFSCEQLCRPCTDSDLNLNKKQCVCCVFETYVAIQLCFVTQEKMYA